MSRKGVTLRRYEASMLPGETVPLKVIHQGNETVVEDGSTALIGSDASASIRIVRPGISRRHAVLSNNGADWNLADAGSRNGTFLDGTKVQTLSIEGPTTLYLGHPAEGEIVSLVPLSSDAEERAPKEAAAAAAAAAAAEPTKPLERAPEAAAVAATRPPRKPAAAPAARPSSAPAVSDVELAQLTAAIRDQISAVKGLTWSVWAMIAVTAILIVLTLFVGILAN